MPSFTRPLYLDGPVSFDAEAAYTVSMWMGEWNVLMLCATLQTENREELTLNRTWLVHVFGEERIKRVEADALEAWRDTHLADYLIARSEQRAWRVGAA